MQPILIRGLRRSFRIEGAPLGSPFEGLHALPDVLSTAPHDETISLAGVGNLWTLSLPNGTQISGTLEGLAAEVDARLVRDACARERETLVIAGSTVVAPDGKRLVLLARRSALKTAAIVELLGSGWRVEGNALTFARPNGFIAYPQAIRIDAEASRVIDPSIDVHLGRPVESFEGRWRTLYPDALGQPWIINEAPASAILFLDLNPGGRRTDIRRLPSQTAFATALNAVTGKPTAASLASLMKQISACSSYRIYAGDSHALKTALVRVAGLLGHDSRQPLAL